MRCCMRRAQWNGRARLSRRGRASGRKGSIPTWTSRNHVDRARGRDLRSRSVNPSWKRTTRSRRSIRKSRSSRRSVIPPRPSRPVKILHTSQRVLDLPQRRRKRQSSFSISNSNSDYFSIPVQSSRSGSLHLDNPLLDHPLLDSLLLVTLLLVS